MQKADSIPSAGATADSEQKDEVSTSCQHSIKPHVVGSQSPSNTDLKQKTIDVINIVNGLTPTEIERVLEDVKYSVRNSPATIIFCHNSDAFLNGYHYPNLISHCQ
jgi:hypothetical protein